MSDDVDELPHLLRSIASEVLGIVARRHRDFLVAEDAVQEALLSASIEWKAHGYPENPRGWLIRVASRRIADEVRSDRARRRREQRALELVPEDEQVVAPLESLEARDDTLDLLFMCAHPSLSRSSAIALTLRAVGGLTTREIAHAFLVPEATMAQRISRAKQTIREAGATFPMPDIDDVEPRRAAVMHVLYLIFSEGYASSGGPVLVRTDLSSEALRLTRMLHRAVPDDAEVIGLLSLMLLTDARRSARSGLNGEIIPLDEQDRRLWDRALIAEGVALVQDALSRGAVGPYQLQAAVAAIHDEAESTDATDWPQILALYGLLMHMSDNPMVALQHAVATAMVHGPDRGLARVAALEADPRLKDGHRLDAVSAHLFERKGSHEEAIARYRRAAERTASIAERDYLLVRAARLERIAAGEP